MKLRIIVIAGNNFNRKRLSYFQRCANSILGQQQSHVKIMIPADDNEGLLSKIRTAFDSAEIMPVTDQIGTALNQAINNKVQSCVSRAL